MKKMILFILSCSLIFCACSENTKTTNLIEWTEIFENHSKFDLMFVIMNYGVIFEEDEPTPTTHRLTFVYTEEDKFIRDISAKINNVEQQIQYFFEIPYVEYDFIQGEFYLIEVLADSCFSSATIRIPFNPIVNNFPDDFDPQLDTTITWHLDQNSQAQFANLYSSLANENIIDHEYTSISPKARQYTFKANSSLLDMPNYNIYIMNTNFVIKDKEKVIFIAIDGHQKFYNKDDSNYPSYCEVNKKMIELVRKLQ